MDGERYFGGRESIAYVIDPRFPGGTSAAVARELRVLAKTHPRIAVYGIRSAMFKGRDCAPILEEALDDLCLDLVWDPRVISADRVVLHNPAFLKFETRLIPRILARALYVVTHENFLRPTAAEAFDVAGCLAHIDRTSLASQKWLAPISPYNRETVDAWRRTSAARDTWSILPVDWFNICNFDLQPPTERPRDRRGRHSRPGYEKFPPLAQMDACFPPEAETNLILGADTFLRDGSGRAHWRMVPFQGMTVDSFFEEIDFHVYFTAPTWRESFGRVLAEALAAGKVVISDSQTARTFNGGVVAASPADVSEVIDHFVGSPDRYREQVAHGQAVLASFSAGRFRDFFESLSNLERRP